jgi:hypothetical protein
MNRLESLIKRYTSAIERRDLTAINKLALAVEREANRVGYSNHGRLKALPYPRRAGIDEVGAAKGPPH